MIDPHRVNSLFSIITHFFNDSICLLNDNHFHLIDPQQWTCLSFSHFLCFTHFIVSFWYVQSNKWHYYNIIHSHPFVNNITCLYSYQSRMISMVILCSIVWIVKSFALLSLPLSTIQQLQINFNSHLVWSKLDFSEERLYLYECLLNSRFWLFLFQ